MHAHDALAYINQYFNGYQNNTIEKIILNDTVFTNSNDLAEIFNNFFVNIGRDLADN